MFVDGRRKRFSDIYHQHKKICLIKAGEYIDQEPPIFLLANGSLLPAIYQPYFAGYRKVKYGSIYVNYF